MLFRKLINKSIPVSEGIKKMGKQMIDNPTEWKQGHFEFFNIKNKDIAIWTCNGINHIKISGFDGLSKSDKIYLNNCIKMSMANRLLKQLN